MENNVLTNYDLLKFFADKPIVADYTKKFEDKYVGGRGGYHDLVRTFKSKGTKGTDIDKAFYDWLKKQESSLVLDILKNEDENFDIFLEKENVNQKWHLFIAWYAYQEFYESKDYKEFCKEYNKTPKKIGLNEDTLNESVFNKPCGIFKSQIVCPELYLWMYEVAITDKRKINKTVPFAENYVKARSEIKSEWRGVIQNDIYCDINSVIKIKKPTMRKQNEN